MTDKEKEIQELERLICPFGYNFSYKNCSECENYRETFEDEDDFCGLDCSVKSRNIYNAGYRKADEVRKEVLDEFYDTHFCAYMQGKDEEVKEPCVEGVCPHFKSVDDIRKEMAKEIQPRVARHCIGVFDYAISKCFEYEPIPDKYTITSEDFEELKENIRMLADEYGVELHSEVD